MINQQKSILLLGDLRPETTYVMNLLQQKGFLVVMGQPELYSQDNVAGRQIVTTDYFNQFEAIVYMADSTEMPDITGYYGLVINDPRMLRVCSSKVYLYNFCEKYKINTIESFTYNQYNPAKHKFPLVCKPVMGRNGYGIEKINDETSLMSYNKSYRSEGIDYIIQPYLSTSYGKIYKAYCAGDTITYATETNEKSFISCGGTVDVCQVKDVPKGVTELVEKVKENMHLDLLTIDIIEKGIDEYAVCDMNFNSGNDGVIEQVNIYEKFVEDIETKVSNAFNM